MAGLSREGFVPLTYDEISNRIKSRLEAFSPGIDLSPEAPDGHLVGIFTFELAQVWTELNSVYNSYNPNSAVGDSLRNLGLLSGLPLGAATRSVATIDLIGTTGTIVPIGSVVSDAKGNEFTTTNVATIPASVQAIATLSGPTNVDAGTLVNIDSPVSGWTSISQPVNGRVGTVAQTETQYRNLRNRTVLRNYTAITDVIKARLLEVLGIDQVAILNNDSAVDTLPDGTPTNTIHVTVGEVHPDVTDYDIGQVILSTKGLGCPTYGSTTVVVKDVQGNDHSISFSKATALPIFMDIEILFLDGDYAGAEENIRNDLLNHINSLDTDEDVVWSRLFGIITPYSKAQVNKLELSINGTTYNAANIVVGATEYASTLLGNINITVVN